VEALELVIPGWLAKAGWWLDVVGVPNLATAEPFEVSFGTPTGTVEPGEEAYSRTIGGETGTVEPASRVGK
jgi:hypothetical protein